MNRKISLQNILLLTTSLLFVSFASVDLAKAGLASEIQIEGKVKRFDQKWVWIEQRLGSTQRFPRNWFKSDQIFRVGKAVHALVPFEPQFSREPAQMATGQKTTETSSRGAK